MNTENKHLANFYMIVPALTINFVEATVQVCVVGPPLFLLVL